MNAADPAKLRQVKQREWFYRFPLPDGTFTSIAIPEHIEKIHTSRVKHLRRTIAQKVVHPAALTAIDFAAHEGYFSIELAKHFSFVRGFEFRPDSVEAACLISDVLGVRNVEYVEADLQHMEFDPSLSADFVLVFGLMYHLEDPIHVLRLASQLCHRHILIETQVFPYDVSGRLEDGSFYNQRPIEGVFGLAPDAPAARLGGSTEWALVPSLNALLSLLRAFGFKQIEVRDTGL